MVIYGNGLVLELTGVLSFEPTTAMTAGNWVSAGTSGLTPSADPVRRGKVARITPQASEFALDSTQ